MPEQTGMNRREFISSSAAGTLAMGFASTVPRTVFGANDRINVALIGVGSKGSGHLGDLLKRSDGESPTVNVVAVCEVWDKRRDEAVERSGADPYLDYRRVLERPDVDAVVIATPDHWHARMSIEAMEAGKDVYCEKPMTLYWEEAKEVAAVARRTGQVYQCGAQSASSDVYWQARRVIRDGGIGKVIWSQASYCRNDPKGNWNYYIDPSANPSNLDWNLWLGPALKRPWSPERYFRFRKFWDYSGGVATDLLYHALAHTQVALGWEFPIEVMATGGNYVHLEREVPDTFHVLVRYPSNHTVVLVSTQENDDRLEDVIRGQHALITFHGSKITIHPQKPFLDRLDEKIQGGIFRQGEPAWNSDGELETIEIERSNRPGHMDNFLDCVRSREKPHLHAHAAYRVMVAIGLSVKSYREKRLIRFDPQTETEIT